MLLLKTMINNSIINDFSPSMPKEALPWLKHTPMYSKNSGKQELCVKFIWSILNSCPVSNDEKLQRYTLWQRHRMKDNYRMCYYHSCVKSSRLEKCMLLDSKRDTS